jgi:sugar/nucleoside kinase (ribokinase family)
MTDLQTLTAAVFGNAALDVICKTVNEVPRHDSVVFEEAHVLPGGCGSNVAVNLARMGVKCALVASIGKDETGDLLRAAWKKVGVDLRFLLQSDTSHTGVSIGLVDDDLQPRFIHTPGANAELTVNSLPVDNLIASGIKHLHIAGYFVLPGLLDGRLAKPLGALQSQGIRTSLDVVTAAAMDDPTPLWSCLPFLDIFLCNQYEAFLLTRLEDPIQAADYFRKRGANNVIIKLGKAGCLIVNEDLEERIPPPVIDHVVDTTGAGDAFAAGLIAALLQDRDSLEACRAANLSGAEAAQHHGAVKIDP